MEKEVFLLKLKNGAVEEGYNRKESEKIMLKFENVFVAKPNNYK